MLTDLFLRFSVPTGAPYNVRIRAASTTSLLIEWTVRFLFLCFVECPKTKAQETFYRRVLLTRWFCPFALIYQVRT